MYGWDGRNLKEHESAPPESQKMFCHTKRKTHDFLYFRIALAAAQGRKCHERIKKDSEEPLEIKDGYRYD